MTIAKVIEVMAQSETSWEDAAQQALAEASSTVHNIENIYIKEQQADVENGEITNYRINAKVTFLVD